MTTTESADRPTSGVGVVVIENGRLLMVKRGHPPGQGLWAVPGGKVRFGETLRAAAVRETKEETGLDVEVGDVVWVGDSIGPGYPPAWHYTLVDFAATVVGGEQSVGDDAVELAWVDLDAPPGEMVSTMHELIEVILRGR